jgi:mannose-1-phosphate guanylyltransferase
MSIGANINRSDIIAAVNQVCAWKDLGFFNKLVEIQDNNGPAVVLQFKRNLSNEAV